MAKTTLQEVADWYDTHCTICKLEFENNECPDGCPEVLERADGGKWHGTIGGYSNHKCRGPLCRMAWADFCRDARKRRTQQTPFEKIPHGSNGYMNYGCRCKVCTRANRERRRKQRGVVAL